jgi:Fe-S cluster assembly ATP-binding protein
VNALLEIRNLHVSVDGEPILRGVDLKIPPGEVHALMGPNGSGKSTLANVIMGHPGYEVTSGEIFYDGEDLLRLSPDERARRGIFLSFQYPAAVPGVSLEQLAYKATQLVLGPERYASVSAFRSHLERAAERVGLDEELVARAANEGFSGGEKKKAEILQMMLLEPRFVVLDEVDSGLDIDALKRVAEAVSEIRRADRSFLVITHYQRILSHIPPDWVHVLKDGRVVRSGGPELVETLEREGYVNLEAA